MLQDTFKVTGNVLIRRYDENGVMNLEREHKNLVVTAGKQLIASRLYSNTTKAITITNITPFKVLATTAATGASGIATLTFTPQTVAPFIVGSEIIVDGITPLGYNTTKTLAITAASGDGTIATLTFASQTVAPFSVGEKILISGVTPTGYNTTAKVTECTQTTVKYANTTNVAGSGGKVRAELLATAIVTDCNETTVKYANTTTAAQTVPGTIKPIGATIGFALQTGAPYYSDAPFEQGAYATIAGVVPVSYNGASRIKTVGTTFITIDSTETASMTSAGQINSLFNGTIKTMRIGESNTVANLSDIALGSEKGSVPLFSRSFSTANDSADLNYIALFPAGVGTSTAGIAEAALMNDSNKMLCRTVFPLVTKSALESLEIFWTVTIN